MVQVTDTPEGMTFTKKRWVLDPDIMSGEKPRTYASQDFIIERTPFVVPSGKWVLEDSLIRGYWSWLVGIEHAELKQVTLHSLYGTHHVLYISDKPFGFVYAEDEDVDRMTSQVKHSGRKTLQYARQIHKGELGRGINIPRLNYVRQPLDPHRGQGMKARDRRRGQRGWVRLADLGEMSGCGYCPNEVVELVLGYWQFSGHRNYPLYENDQDGGQLVDIAWGYRHDIENGTAEFMSLTPSQFREECDDTSDAWIRRGFAFTILRLQALGVQPEVKQHA